MLKAKHIYKKFDQDDVIQNVNLHIAPGTITVIVGPSGSGKTTLLRMLGMLEFPDKGTVTLDEQNYQLHSGEESIKPWPKVSMVFQQLFLWPHLSLEKNITLPLGKYPSLQQSEKLAKLADHFKMSSYLQRYPNEVSLGQKQRVALMRALMLEPKYLLLDEITASLDVEQAAAIINYLVEIKKQGVGVVLVTHDIHFALAIADQMIFIEGGRIIKQGKPFEFLLEESSSSIKNFMQAAFAGFPNIKVYTGEEQFQAYHLSLLERLPEKSQIFIIGALGGTWYEPMKERYLDYVHLRHQKKIAWHMLMYESGEEENRLLKKDPALNFFHRLPTDVKNLANINVMNDEAIILQVFHPTPMVIEIKNSILAKAYLRYYEDLLKISTPLIS